jgi:hypothetical protein
LEMDNQQSSGKTVGCIPKRRRKTRTVADSLRAHAWACNIHGNLGIQELGQYLMLWPQVEHVTLTNQPDQLIWKWTSGGTYSAQSCYVATFQGSKRCNATLGSLFRKLGRPHVSSFSTGWPTRTAAGPSTGCTAVDDNTISAASYATRNQIRCTIY